MDLWTIFEYYSSVLHFTLIGVIILTIFKKRFLLIYSIVGTVYFVILLFFAFIIQPGDFYKFLKETLFGIAVSWFILWYLYERFRDSKIIIKVVIITALFILLQIPGLINSYQTTLETKQKVNEIQEIPLGEVTLSSKEYGYNWHKVIISKDGILHVEARSSDDRVVKISLRNDKLDDLAYSPEGKIDYSVKKGQVIVILNSYVDPKLTYYIKTSLE